MSGRGVNATGETRPYQRKCDGRWIATYYRNGKLRNVSAKTEREVVAKRRLALSQVEESRTAGTITVAEMADRWLATLPDPLSLNHVADVAVYSYSSVVRRHICPAPKPSPKAGGYCPTPEYRPAGHSRSPALPAGHRR